MSRHSSTRRDKDKGPSSASHRKSSLIAKESSGVSSNDFYSQLTIEDAPMDQLVNLLQECNLFDDNDREHDLEITLADLQSLLRVGGNVSTVEKCMRRMADEDKYFVTFGPFLTEVSATKNRLEEEDVAKATIAQMASLDPFFPQIIEYLTTGSFFRECELGSVDVSVEDLSKMIKIAKGGKPLLKILEQLNQEKIEVSSVDELKALIKARRKKRPGKGSGPPLQIMAGESSRYPVEEKREVPRFFPQSSQQNARTSPQTVSELEGEEGDVTVPRFTRVCVEAGGSFMETLTITPGPPSQFGTHVSWHFKEQYGYDINFSVTCNGMVVRSPTRCSSDKGSYDTPPNVACELCFVWDNSFSWINAKDIEWFFFIFSAKEAEEQRTEQLNSKAERESLKAFTSAFDQLSLEAKQIKKEWSSRRAQADRALAEAQQKHALEMQTLSSELALADHQMHQKRLADLYSILDKLEKMGSTRCQPLRNQVSDLVTNFREG